jgi:hypothetical protein
MLRANLALSLPLPIGMVTKFGDYGYGSDFESSKGSPSGDVGTYW